MKYTKESLQEICNKLTATVPEFDGKSTEELLAIHAEQAKIAFQKREANGEITDENRQAAMRPVSDACTAFSDWKRLERLDALKALGTDAAAAAYLADRTVPGVVCKYTEDEGLKLDGAAVTLDAIDYFDAMVGAVRNNVMDAVCIFADNVARMFVHDDGARISKASAHATYIQIRKDKGWDWPVDGPAEERLSWNKLAGQMTTIVRWIYGKAMPEMHKADAKFVGQTLLGTNGADTNTGNKTGEYTVRDEKTIIRAITMAVVTHLKDKPYTVTNKTRMGSGDKSALTKEANKAMAESSQTEEFQPPKPTEAGEVAIGKAAPKKTTKKSTKKAEKPAESKAAKVEAK